MTMKCILIMSSLILYGFYYLIKYVDWKFHKQQLNNFLELFFVGCAINATVINKVPVFNGKNLFQYLFKIDTEYAITKCTIFIHSLKINKTIPKHWPLIHAIQQIFLFTILHFFRKGKAKDIQLYNQNNLFNGKDKLCTHFYIV